MMVFLISERRTIIVKQIYWYIYQISGERLHDLHFSIPNRFVSSNIYDIKSAVTLTLIYTVVNFLFLDGDAPLRASYGVYISQLIRFASL